MTMSEFSFIVAFGYSFLVMIVAGIAYHLGMPERVTMEIGGWADNQTMHKIYIHIARQDVSKYANEFKKFFSSKEKPADE